MATSLESQLIAGAGRAVAKDPYGMVRQAQSEAGRKLTTGITGIATALATKKIEREAEIEAEKKKQEDTRKGYSDNFDKNEIEFFDNLGLGMNTYSEATTLAKEIKEKHTACEYDDDPNLCRRKAIAELRQLSTIYADKKAAQDAIYETKQKMDGTYVDPETGETVKLELSEQQTNREAGILAGINDDNSATRMSNDEDIADVNIALNDEFLIEHGYFEGKEATGAMPYWIPEDEKTMDLWQNGTAQDRKNIANKYIEQLEKTNKRQSGWNVTYENEDYATVTEFVTKDDIGDLQPHIAYDVKGGYAKNLLDVSTPQWEAYKTGADGGKAFDKNKSISIHEQSIDKDNIASIYYDKEVLGTDQPLREHLKSHPVVLYVGKSYEDLGMTASNIEYYDRKPKDGIVQKEEMLYDGELNDDWEYDTSVSTDDLISALSDPENDNYDFERSKKVAAEWMADNEQMEYNKHMYGDDFFDLTTAEKNTRIKERTTQNPGESDAEYGARGGIKGVQKGADMIWDEVLQRSVKTKAPAGADDLE